MNIQNINSWFEKQAKHILHYRWIGITLFTIAIVIGMSGLPHMNITTSWDDYFLEDDPMLIKTDEFKEIFGNDNFVAVLTKCDDSFTHKNLSLIRELSNELMDSISYADKITSLTDIEYLSGTDYGMTIEQIVPPNIPTNQQALNKIRHKAYSKEKTAQRLISKDGKYSWILLKLRTFPDTISVNKQHKKVSAEMQTGQEVEHILKKEKYADLHPLGTGMPYLSYKKMEWFGGEMPKTFGGALILAILVLLLITKSFRGVIVPVLTSISSIIIVYGLIGYSGYAVDSSMISIPILVAFAISIAYNIHIITYFKRQFNTHGKRKQAVIETISEMGWPVLFSALTTFMALLTIIFIPVVPLHFVGIATSSCVFITFLFALIIMPIFLSFGKNKKVLQNKNKEHKTGMDKFLAHIGNWSLSHGNALLVLFTIIMILFLIGATKIETAFDVERTMGRKIEYVDNILTVSESELGSIYSYDILVEFKEENQAKHYQNLMQLDSLSQYINQLPLTKRTTSVLDIVKDLNQTINENQKSQYTIPYNDNQIAQLLLLYENAGGSEAEYWIDYDYRRLRIMVELNNYNSQEAEKELQQVNTKAQKLFPNAKVTTVGALPQFTAMMQYVVRGQIVSFGLALLVITLLLMLVFGKVKIGLVGIIPNIVPAIVVGGIMGWLDIPLDMMSATIIPMILGLSVDDTIHFINHSHLEFNRQRSYFHAVRRTFFIVGSPMVLTTLIISSNFGVYLLSEGNSIFNMGFLSVAGMLSALLSDLFITPVLIEKFKLFGPENK